MIQSREARWAQAVTRQVLVLAMVGALDLSCGSVGGNDGGTGGGAGGSGGGVGGGAAGGSGGGAGGSGGGAASHTFPSDTSDPGLTAFVVDGGFRSVFHSEAAIHASAGPHGRVRTWVNEALYQSMKAGGAAPHPNGSAAVKELFDSSNNLTGYAVDVKDFDGGWVYYERFAPSFSSGYYYRGTGNLCSNCHASGRDMVLLPASALP